MCIHSHLGPRKKETSIYQHNEIDDEQAEPIELQYEKQAVVVVVGEKRDGWMIKQNIFSLPVSRGTCMLIDDQSNNVSIN